MLKTTRCQLEALEDRSLPSVTTALLNGGTTLSITSDAQDDRVNILQNDDNDELVVTWQTITPEPSPYILPAWTGASSSIKRIVVNMGAGNDRVYYQLNSQSMTWEKSLSVDLGAGDDSALFDFGGQLFVILGGEGDSPEPSPANLMAKLVIDVQGGNGTDTIDAIFGNVNNSLSYRVTGGAGTDYLSTQVAGNMNSAARVLIDQDGGAGNDRLWADLGNKSILSGAVVTINQRGGAGNDNLAINAWLQVYGVLGLNQWGGAGDDVMTTSALLHWQSTGIVSARSYGEAGNDKQTLQIKRQDVPENILLFAPMPPMRIGAVLQGGLGRNTATVTPNVRTFLTFIQVSSWDVSQPVPLA